MNRARAVVALGRRATQGAIRGDDEDEGPEFGRPYQAELPPSREARRVEPHAHVSELPSSAGRAAH